MTFDREPDLDNANVGMPDIIFGSNTRNAEAAKSAASFVLQERM